MIRLVGNSRTFLLLFIVTACSLSARGQSFADAEREKIVVEARKQLVIMSSPGGALFKVCAKNNVSGDFVVDLTIGGKGKILTVFMASSIPESISNQNFLKSVLSDLQFNVNVPKTERIKFRHTLTF
jgi:hypothetical protein